jgi:hypothetical protein
MAVYIYILKPVICHHVPSMTEAHYSSIIKKKDGLDATIYQQIWIAGLVLVRIVIAIEKNISYNI